MLTFNVESGNMKIILDLLDFKKKKGYNKMLRDEAFVTLYKLALLRKCSSDPPSETKLVLVFITFFQGLTKAKHNPTV